MFTIPNQSSVPMAYQKFTAADAPEGGSRLMPGGNRDRLADCVEEMIKFSLILREHFDLFNDRSRERRETEARSVQNGHNDAKDVVNGVDLKAL